MDYLSAHKQDSPNGQESTMNGIVDIVELVDQNTLVRQALNEIRASYGVTVSAENKAKSLLKFGSRTTIGTTWETMMEAVGDGEQEILLSKNAITSIVSDNAADVGDVSVQYHTITDGKLAYGQQLTTINGTTPVLLDVPCARASRIKNEDVDALLGNVYVYEGGTRTDENTHIMIIAGDNQTQKCATSISSDDYWIVTGASINVLSKITKYTEARIEVRPVGVAHWKPITQTFSATDSTGTIQLHLAPYKIVPANTDIRLAVKTNTSGVIVSGGVSGFLAN